MKNLIKRFITGVITFAVMSLSAMSAFAADAETNNIEATGEQECIALTVTSDGITSATNADSTDAIESAITGYGYACLRYNEDAFLIYTDESGIGRVGFTIKTQCDTWDGDTKAIIGDNNANMVTESMKVHSNGEIYFTSERIFIFPERQRDGAFVLVKIGYGL